MNENAPKRGILKLRKKEQQVPVRKIEKNGFDLNKLYFVPLSELPIPSQYEHLISKINSVNIELNLKPPLPTIGSVNQISETLFESIRDIGEKTSALYREFKVNFTQYVEAWHEKHKDNHAYLNRLKNEYQHLMTQEQIKATRPIQVTVPSRFETLEHVSGRTIAARPTYYEFPLIVDEHEAKKFGEEQTALAKKIDQYILAKLTGFSDSLDEAQKNLFLSYWGIKNHYFTKNEYASQYNLSISEVNRSLSRLNKQFAMFDHNLPSIDKKDVKTLFASSYFINFEEVFNEATILFYAPYRMLKMLELLFDVKHEHLFKYHGSITVRGLTYALLAWHRLPLDINYLREFLIVNYDYLPFEAHKIIASYEKMDDISIDDYMIVSEPLPPLVKISQHLLSYPSGQAWEDIVLNLDIFDTDKIPDDVKNMRTLFYSGMGEFSHVNFIQAAPDFINQLIANALDFLQEKDTQSCQLFEFIEQLSDSFNILNRYQIKHLLRMYGFQYNIILTDEFDDTLMSLSKKSTSMAYFIPEAVAEDISVEASIACENLIISLLKESASVNASETLKSIAAKTNTEFQTVKRHIDSLLKKQIVYKINVNKNFVLFDHYFSDVDFDQITKFLSDLFDNIKRPAEMSALCKELTPLFETSKSKNFLEDVILVIAQRQNWFVNNDLVSKHSLPYASLNDLCRHNIVTGRSLNFNIRNIYSYVFALFKSIEAELTEIDAKCFANSTYKPSSLEELDGYLSAALHEFMTSNYGFQKTIIDSKLFLESDSTVKDRADLYHYSKNVLSKIEIETQQIAITSFEIDPENMDELCSNCDNLSKSLKKTRQCFSSDKLFLGFISKLANNKSFTLSAKTKQVTASGVDTSILNSFWKVNASPAETPAVTAYLDSFVQNSDETLAALAKQKVVEISGTHVSPRKLELDIAVPHVLASQPNGLEESEIIDILKQEKLLAVPVKSLEFYTPEPPCYKDDDYYFHENQFSPYMDILDALSYMIEQSLVGQPKKKTATLIISNFIAENSEMITESLEDLGIDGLITIDTIQHGIRYFIDRQTQKHNLTFNTEKKQSVKLRDTKKNDQLKTMDIAGEIIERAIIPQEESSVVALGENMEIPVSEYVLNCMKPGKEYSENDLVKICTTLSFVQLNDALYTLIDDNQIVKTKKQKYKRSL